MNKQIEDLISPYKEKLSKIKVALFDVDGVLTDARLYWAGEEVGYNRFFNAYDGYGLKMLMRAGIEVGVITGGDSEGVIRRFTDLSVHHLYYGNEDKRAAFNDIIEKAKVTPEEVLYMGDEFFDLPVLKRAGFAATVPDAGLEIKAEVDYVTKKAGGRGAVREVIDLLRWSQGIVPEIEY